MQFTFARNYGAVVVSLWTHDDVQTSFFRDGVRVGFNLRPMRGQVLINMRRLFANN